MPFVLRKDSDWSSARSISVDHIMLTLTLVPLVQITDEKEEKDCSYLWNAVQPFLLPKKCLQPNGANQHCDFLYESIWKHLSQLLLFFECSDSATLPLNYLLTVISSEHTPGRWTLVFHLVTQFSSVVVFLFFSFSAHPSPFLLTTSSCDSFILRLRGKVGGGGCCTVLQSWMGSLSLPCVLHNVQSCQNALPTKPLLIHRLFHVQLTVCTLKKNYIFFFISNRSNLQTLSTCLNMMQIYFKHSLKQICMSFGFSECWHFWLHVAGFLLLTVCISHIKLATTHFLPNQLFCIFCRYRLKSKELLLFLRLLTCFMQAHSHMGTPRPQSQRPTDWLVNRWHSLAATEKRVIPWPVGDRMQSLCEIGWKEGGAPTPSCC